ncbi:MAG: hypothetical protein AMXMBFR33_36180 [Candidatus Xenobia bacterium]|jgi:hypothetical protein
MLGLLALPALCQPAAVAGVVVNGSTLHPGAPMPLVIGVMGPPDFVRAMRGQRQEDDYVMFTYPNHGVSFDINSSTNKVQGILVEGSSARLEGVPFRIGDNQLSVTSSWGRPERTEVGMLVYWRRGVYLGLDDSGRILRVFLTEPGQFQEAGQG